MRRGDVCPHPDDLLRDELGELPVHRSVALRAHVDGCASCQARRAAGRQMAEDLGSPASMPDGARPDERAFLARVEAAVRAEPRGPRTEAAQGAGRVSWWRDRRAPALWAVAAALVLVPAAVTLGLRPRGSGAPGEGLPVEGQLTARGGGAAAGARLAAEVLLVRGGRLQPLDGQAVCGAEALAVRVTNLSGRAVHVMAFGRDAAGEVHWLYPGYADAQTNPSSVAIADGANGRVLDEIVQPEAPASGPIRFVTLLSAEPLRVKDVEARLGAAAVTSDIARLFPGVVAREEIARCEARR